MNIVVAGGSGFIGRALCRALGKEGHRINVLSRHPRDAAVVLDPSVTTIWWDGVAAGAWERVLEGADAVINLVGEPIARGRWTKARKQELWESRISTTRVLVDAIGRCRARPAALINASAIGYYGPAANTPLTEESPPGTGFLAELSQAWEQEALRAMAHEVRVVCIRIGMVLERDGGALPRMLPAFQLFVGGPISPGTQWVSWIHRADLVRLIQWCLNEPGLSGPMNAVAPDAVTMHAFAQTLGRTLRKPSWLSVPAFALNLMLGEVATLLTTGQRIVPLAALRSGFHFLYPELKQAFEQILVTTEKRP